MSLLMRWADLEGRPRILVRPDGGLLWSNLAADAAMDDGLDVRRADGRFELAQPAEQAAFLQFLSGASGSIGAWCSPQAGDGVIIFRAWRIDVEGDEAIGLVFHSTGGDYVPRWADFGRALGLTATEHRIALRLLDGIRIESVARDMGITLATARTHVRNLYQKLSIGSREALFRRLAPFRIA